MCAHFVRCFVLLGIMSLYGAMAVYGHTLYMSLAQCVMLGYATCTLIHSVLLWYVVCCRDAAHTVLYVPPVTRSAYTPRNAHSDTENSSRVSLLGQ